MLTVTHCVIEGPQAEMANFKKLYAVPSGIDFVALIPPPERLVDSWPEWKTFVGLLLLRRHDLVRSHPLYSAILSAHPFKDNPLPMHFMPIERVLEAEKRALELAKEAIRSHEDCGYTDCIAWAQSNFGSLTRAVDGATKVVENTSTRYEFVMANFGQFPRQVFNRINQTFPPLSVYVATARKLGEGQEGDVGYGLARAFWPTLFPEPIKLGNGDQELKRALREAIAIWNDRPNLQRLDEDTIIEDFDVFHLVGWKLKATSDASSVKS